MKTTTKSGLKVTTNVKAAGLPAYPNHSRTCLKVKANVRAGTFITFHNHNSRLFSLTSR
jgi:hypothetical protein